MPATLRAPAALAIVLLSCSRAPTPPESSIDPLGLAFDPAAGVYRDSSGQPLADIPEPFRGFYLRCAQCHSGLAREQGLSPQAPVLNTWEDIGGYGPDRLLVLARAVHPPGEIPRDSTWEKVQSWMALWDRGDALALRGALYVEAQIFANRYCADCHTRGGTHPDQPRARSLLRLDTYEHWWRRQDDLKDRLDPSRSAGRMPPANYAFQPDEGERRTMLAWLARNSPNLPDPFNAIVDDRETGDSTHIPVTSGAIKGTRYEPALRLVNLFCADCHTRGGMHEKQPGVWEEVLKLDTYEDWKAAEEKLAKSLDPAVAAAETLEVMPQRSFPYQPTPAQRDTLLEWIRKGSPNTLDGN